MFITTAAVVAIQVMAVGMATAIKEALVITMLGQPVSLIPLEVEVVQATATQMG